VADVRYLAQVARDLAEISDHISRDNPRAAVAFIDDIRRHCSLLEKSPLMGRMRPDIDRRCDRFLTDRTACSIGFFPRKTVWRFLEYDMAAVGYRRGRRWASATEVSN
jgi:plasmid stabilization system protein ParE